MIHSALKLIVAGSFILAVTLSGALAAQATASTGPEGTHCVTPDGHPYITSYVECPPPAGEPMPEIGEAQTLERGELPQTGTRSRLLYTAIALIIVGGLIYMVALVGSGPVAIPPVHPGIESE